MTPTIEFLGAAGTVTGSKFLLETGRGKLLVGPQWRVELGWETTLPAYRDRVAIGRGGGR